MFLDAEQTVECEKAIRRSGLTIPALEPVFGLKLAVFKSITEGELDSVLAS